MKLINKTKSKIITNDLYIPKTWLKKIRGLLTEKQPKTIYFKTRWGIHTFGMNFSIDCVIADKNMIVRKIRNNMKPNDLFLWNPFFNNVIEMPAGTIQEKNIEILDQLQII